MELRDLSFDPTEPLALFGFARQALCKLFELVADR